MGNCWDGKLRLPWQCKLIKELWGILIFLPACLACKTFLPGTINFFFCLFKIENFCKQKRNLRGIFSQIFIIKITDQSRQKVWKHSLHTFCTLVASDWCKSDYIHNNWLWLTFNPFMCRNFSNKCFSSNNNNNNCRIATAITRIRNQMIATHPTITFQ